MIRRMWRWGLNTYLVGVAVWLLAWNTVRDWGIGGLLNAWGFWLLLPALPLGAARLSARRTPTARFLALLWAAGGLLALSSRYRWLRRAGSNGAGATGGDRLLPAEARRKWPSQELNSFSVLSLNVLKENQSPGEILELIRRLSPDVALLQELEPEMSRELHEGLDEYDHCHWQSHRRPGGGFGFFSRAPFEITGAWDWPATRPYAVRATVNLREGPVDLYNVHLISVGPGALLKTGLTGNFRIREAEISALADEIGVRGLPALAIGDYNMTEGNEAYRRASERLVDAWLVAGRGPGWTWPRLRFPPKVPILRLDYCFCTPDVRPVSMSVLREPVGSDHCPILIEAAVDGYAALEPVGLPWRAMAVGA